MVDLVFAVTATRLTFEGIPEWAKALWYTLSLASTAVFVFGVAGLVGKYHRGRTTPGALGGVSSRLSRAVRVTVTNSWILRDKAATGVAHLLAFYGFVVLFIGTAILFFEDDIARPLFGFDFYRDEFYLGYSAFMDVFGGLLFAGLVFFAVRRSIVRPRALDYRRPDFKLDSRCRYVVGDWIFVGTLLLLAATGFLLEAFRDAETNPGFEKWAPLGWGAAQVLRAAGFSNHLASNGHLVLWWIHGLVAIAWVAAIPYTKAVHMLVAPVSIALRDDRAGKRFPPVPDGAPAGEIGYRTITDLTWHHLVNLDACTKCGRCHEVCPANAGGYPLSPRDLILDLREFAEGSIGLRNVLHIPPHPLFADTEPLVPSIIRADTIWSCTTCMACVEVCPVGIEHVPIINQLRRSLVERGAMERQLQQTLEAIYTTGNSFAEHKRKRSNWTKQLPFRVKDIRREPADVLWFVGDYASFDPRNQLCTTALARILHAAGVDFGTLMDGEQNDGCDVRRVGEEGLFRMLAQENVKTISDCRFSRIMTSDPHSYHTLRNEYPDAGGTWAVLHHSQLLLELFESGAIAPANPLEVTVTYHDPCTLGRYNGVYEAPRRVLKLIGCEVREMPRSRANSFCCGAGGGRLWMNEARKEGVRRPSEQRIDEAVALGDVDYFVVACPKDVAMYEDAIKTSGHSGQIALRELSELVLEALALEEARLTTRGSSGSSGSTT